MEYQMRIINEDIDVSSSIEYILLYFVFSGKAKLSDEKKESEYKEGDFFVVPPFSNPKIIKNTGELIEVSINKLSFNRFSLYTSEELPVNNRTEYIKKEILNLVNAVLNSDVFNADMHMFKIINFIHVGGYYNNYNNIMNPLLINVLKYVNENYKKELTVTNISEHFYVNTSYLSRLFSETLNISLLKYIRKVKMYNIAVDIIRLNSDHNLWREYGYKSYDLYLKNFKTVFNVSPKDFITRYKL